MKKNYTYLLPFFVLYFFSTVSFSQSEIFESYLVLNVNNNGDQFYDLKAETENPDFDGTNLGTFLNTHNFILKGAENKTVKCGTHDIINGWLNYRIYSTADSPPGFSSTPIAWAEDESGAGDGCHNQKWQTINYNIDLLAGLPSGDYVLEVYTHADVNINAIFDHAIYANNNAQNYKAFFRVDNPPVANCVEALTVYLDASGNATITPEDLNDNSTDDFGIAEVSIDIDTFNCTNIGISIPVTLTVTDSVGQTHFCIVEVTVLDNLHPTASSPAPIMVACVDDVPAPDSSVVTDASDNCSITTVTFVGDVSDGNSNPEILTRTYSVTDGAGNSINVNQTITVNDTENPTISCPDEVTFYTDTSCGVSTATLNLGTPITSDNCGIASVTNNLDSFGSSLATGTFEIIWTVTDTSGNTGFCNQKVTVIDNSIPTITSCPVPLPSYNTDAGLCFTTLSFEATADDTCSSPTIVYSVDGSQITFPYDFPVGNTTVVVTATLGNLNTDSCSFVVKVIDDQKPLISVPEAIAVPLNVTDCFATINLTTPEATDNCGIQSITNNHLSSSFVIGITNVIWTVTDIHGNSETVTQVVTVTDPASISYVQLTSSEMSICIGTPITFTATAVDADSNPTYEWFVNGISQGPASTNPVWTTSTLAVGTHKISVKLTSGPCRTPKTSPIFNITVKPNLPVSFTLQSPTSICEGLGSFSIGNRKNFGAFPTFVWKIDGTVVPGATSDTFNPTNLITGQTVSVEVTSSLDCAVPLPVIQSKTVIVNPLPSVTANANGSSTDIFICEGGKLTLTGSGSAESYKWDNGATNGFEFTPNVGSYTYTVIGTDSNGCRSSDQINVTVVAAPKITLVKNNKNNQEICNIGAIENISYTITNSPNPTVLGLPAGISYAFNGSVLTISGSPIDTSLNTYNYTVIATNASCSPGASATGSIKVYDGKPDVTGEISGITVVCPTTITTFSVPNDINVNYYRWTLPTGIVKISGGNTNSITVRIDDTFDPDASGDQRIRVRAENKCGYANSYSYKTLLKNSVSINLNAGDDAIICAETSLDLSGSVISQEVIDHNGLTFQWSDGGAGGTFTNGTELLATYKAPPVTVLTTVTLTLTANFPIDGLCEAVSDQLAITVYPKPIAVVTSEPIICEGDEILFTGTPYTDVYYDFLPPGGDTIRKVVHIGKTGYEIFKVPAGEYFGQYVQYRSDANNPRPDCEVELKNYVFINAAPTIYSYPNQTICSNKTVTLKDNGTKTNTYGGTNPSGLWSTSGDGTFETPDNKNSKYTPGPNDILYGSVTLTFTNTPTDGICSPLSKSMIVTIKDPVVIDTPPAPINACAGENITFSVGASGDDLIYQWYRNSILIPGATSKTLTINNVSVSDVGDYSVKVSGYSSCGSVTSIKAKLTVNTVKIINAPLSATICEGSSTTLTATATGTALTYQWYHNGNPVSNATNASLTINNARLIDSGTYYVMVGGDYCTPIPSATAVVTVTGKPIATISYPDVSYCTSDTQKPVILSGVHYTGGTFSSTPGLSINSANGTITPATSTAGKYTVTYTIGAAGGCTVVKTSTTITIYEVNPPAFAGTDPPTTECTITNYTLAAAPISASGATGMWSVTSGQTSGFFFSNPTNPTSEFTGESGETYTLRWTITNAGDCGNSFDEVTISIADCGNNIFFDGDNDYVNFNNNYNLGSAFSIEVWVKRSNYNSKPQTLFSKRNGSNTASGYDLSIVNNVARFRWNNNPISSTEKIQSSRWYHIAVTYDNNTYSMYVNGKLQNTVTGASAPSPNTSNSLLGATAQPNGSPMYFFGGDFDEFRIWKKALTTEQIQLLMNQEIESNSGILQGSITKADVPTNLNWSDLLGYYQMNQNVHISDGTLTATGGGIPGKLINMSGQQAETAPLPYKNAETASATNWDDPNTWLGGTDQMIPNTQGVSWNIVQTDLNISINRPVTVLGLVVNNNKLSVSNNESLEVTKYLKIDGVLDLVGESQLLQPEGSIVDYTGSGHLERDQQGTGNKFNYNYWGSPVISTEIARIRFYRLEEILYDADADQKVKFIAGNDGNPGPPVNIARRWLYTYNATTNKYENTWNRISETTPIKSGLGFLMKGANNVGSASKNYTFIGQPNNGTITNMVYSGNTILVGNPYPSAIDAKAFIMDNGPRIENGQNKTILEDGAISYWEHYASNNTHILRDYVGGYATYNLIGGQLAVTPPPTIDGYKIANGGMGSKKPTQFIPVGQGFFVTASETGGEVIFKNSQRIFRKEAGGQSIFFKTAEASSSETQQSVTSSEPEDDIQRVRLIFKTPEGAIRPLLLGFTSDHSATDGIDYGYDAYNNDDFPSDLSFAIAGKTFVIQGVGAFDITKKYPLDMKLKVSGPIEISLTELENFEEAIDIFIYDTLLDTYTKINNSSFSITMEAGKYPNRFYLVFQPDTTLETIDHDFKDVAIKYLQKTNEIYVKLPASIEVHQLYLINMAGQTVKSWNMTNMNFGTEFKVPVKDLAEGNYILKAETNTNSFNKKVIIKF